MGRFDYVAYDGTSQLQQATLKSSFEKLEATLEEVLPSWDKDTGRAKALIMTNLEQAYMWCGKAIRDKQLARNAETKPQEERTNS